MSDATPADLPIVGVLGVGVVGARVVRLLARSGVVRVAAFDERPSAAQAAARAHRDVVALDSPQHLAAADLVVLAHPAPQCVAAAELLDEGCSVVSTSDDLADVRELLSLAPKAAAAGRSLVVGAAMSPGLSGLLARHLADRLHQVDEIHVASHGTGGPACARQHHRALSGRAVGWHDHEWIERQAGTGRELCWFPDPIGARDCYRAELPDPVVLQMAFPGVSRISARLSATRRDRLTAPLPMLSPPHREGGIGALRVEVRGCDADGRRESYVVGVAERVGVVSAAVAASVAVRVSAQRLPPGAVVLGADLGVAIDLLDDLVERGVALREFVGVAH